MTTVGTSGPGGGGVDKDARQTEKSVPLTAGSPIAEIIGRVLVAVLGILELAETASVTVISIVVTIIL